jgi:hypothetical protein
MSVSDEIKAVYGALPGRDVEQGVPPIAPYIGTDYDGPENGRLRIAAVGINSYYKGMVGHPPERFREWVEKPRYRFFTGIAREAEYLAADIAAQLGEGAVNFDIGTGLYVTNAVKRYLPEECGRYAKDVHGVLFDEGTTVWKQELQLLANAGVLPHAIMVFGARSWEPVWRTLWELCEDQNEPAFIRYRSMPSGSPLYHRLNTVDVATPSGQRPLLLFRPDHASTSRKTTVSSLFAMPEFRERVEELRGKIG